MKCMIWPEREEPIISCDHSHTSYGSEAALDGNFLLEQVSCWHILIETMRTRCLTTACRAK